MPSAPSQHPPTPPPHPAGAQPARPAPHPPAPSRAPGLCRSHPHAPDSIVNHHGLLGSARDGVVVLEEPQVAAGVGQQGVVGQRVAAVGTGTAGVGERQAVQDLCPPAQGQSHPGPASTPGPHGARTQTRREEQPAQAASVPAGQKHHPPDGRAWAIPSTPVSGHRPGRRLGLRVPPGQHHPAPRAPRTTPAPGPQPASPHRRWVSSTRSRLL